MANMVDRLAGASSSLAFKAPCRLATTAAITLSGYQSIDGVLPTSSDHADLRRILVKNQVTSSANGIYIMDTGPWERARDFDSVIDIRQGTSVYVYAGSTQSGSYRVSSSVDPETFEIDDDNITFAAIGGTDFLGGPLYIADGTAAAPGLAFGADTDTGLYRIAANTLGLSVGGTGELQLTSAALAPITNDGLALGIAGTNEFSDAFFASGAVLDFNNGDVTIAHSANALAFAGALGGYSFDAPITAPQILLTTPLSIEDGGTGQSTAAAAFDALSPLTTRGDLIFRNATTNTRLAASTSGYHLQTNGAGTDLTWAGFLQSGTGASTRTWQDKARDFATFKDFGAVGGGVLDDTTAVTNALAAGVAIDGGGLTYGVSGNITLPGSTYIRNATFKQLTPSAAGDVRTLTSTSVNNITLDNVTVNRNGNGTNGALNDDAGIYLAGGTNIVLRGVEVFGDDMGTGIVITTSFRVTLDRCYVHDMNYSLGSDPGDDRVQGIWINNCNDVELIKCKVHDLGGNFGGGATTQYSRGHVLSGNTALRITSCHSEDVDQGFDHTGSVGNTNFTLSTCTTMNVRSWGFKFAGANNDGVVTGCIARRSGYAGFTVTDLGSGTRTENIAFVNCHSYEAGYNGVYAASSPSEAGFLVQETSGYPQNIRFIVCQAIDQGGAPTMNHGFTLHNPSSATVYALDCRVIGNTGSAYNGIGAIGRQSDTFRYYSAQDTPAEGAITAAGRALLDDADAAAQRTTLAAAGTGVANTFTAAQTVQLTAAGAAQTLTSTDAGAGSGPDFVCDRVSASPAVNDLIGSWIIKGRDSGGNETTYTQILNQILDPTNGSEDAVMYLYTTVAGTLAIRAAIGGGVYHPSATGGDKGNGTLNFVELYENNVAITAPDYVFDKHLGAAKTYSAPVQEKYDELDPAMFDIGAFSQHWKEKGHLYGLTSLDDMLDDKKVPSVGSRINQLIQAVELMAIHIDNLNARLKTLGV